MTSEVKLTSEAKIYKFHVLTKLIVTQPFSPTARLNCSNKPNLSKFKIYSIDIRCSAPMAGWLALLNYEGVTEDGKSKLQSNLAKKTLHLSILCNAIFSMAHILRKNFQHADLQMF